MASTHIIGGTRESSRNFQSEEPTTFGYARNHHHSRPWAKESSMQGIHLSSYSIISTDLAAKKSKSKLLFDIPSALPRARKTEADIEFDKKKIFLAHRLPLLNREEIDRLRLPRHEIVMNELTSMGYHNVVRELKFLIENEKLLARRMDDSGLKYAQIWKEAEMFETIADGFKYAADVVRQNQYLVAIGIRKTIAEYMLKTKDKIWLAKHLYQTCLDLTDEIKRCGQVEEALKLRCEIKCIMGYLEMNDKDGEHISDFSMENAISLIEESREISKGQDWVLELLEPKVLTIKLKKPISLLGLRDDYEIIDGHSMSLHSVATLLLYEMFHLKASAIIYSKAEDKSRHLHYALHYGKSAFDFAFEIHDNVALNSAYMVLGDIYFQMGDFHCAIQTFTDLQNHADFQQDSETEAIAFCLIGRCFVRLQDPVNALENFVCQKEVAELHGLLDLEMDALKNIGGVLLEEGSTVEAELCFIEALHGTQALLPQPPNFAEICDDMWVKSGITAGLNLWGRFAGYCRRENNRDLHSIAEWKRIRRPLRPVPHPRLTPQAQTPFNIYDEFQASRHAAPLPDPKHVRITLSQPSTTEIFKIPTDRLVAQAKYSKVQAQDVGRLKKNASSVTGTDLRVERYPSTSTEAMSRNTFLRKEAAVEEMYDEGEPIIYESDMNRSAKRSGELYELGKNKFKLVTLQHFMSKEKRIKHGVRLESMNKSFADKDEEHHHRQQKISQLPQYFQQRTSTARTMNIIMVPADSICSMAAVSASEFERDRSKMDFHYGHGKDEGGNTTYGEDSKLPHQSGVLYSQSRKQSNIKIQNLMKSNLGSVTFSINRLGASMRKNIELNIARIS